MLTTNDPLERNRRISPALLAIGLTVAIFLAFLLGRHTAHTRVTTKVLDQPAGSVAATPDDSIPEPTLLRAHNLELRKGPHFRVYVRWIRGQMLSTRKGQHASLDAPESFLLDIEKGVINAKYSDIADFLNSGQVKDAPLTGISIENHDGQLQIKGIAHKGLPLPVRLDGTLTPMPDGRLKYHLVKLNVLKVPMKGLLGMFHIELSDLMPHPGTPGMEIAGNDVYLDTQRILPPPHIHGRISSVTASGSDLTVIYGNAKNDEEKLAQWHNFLRLTGGTLDFSKLTMRKADLTMIDASQDPWFDLDLANYQEQLVYGITRITRDEGVEMYMPDLNRLPASASTKGVSVDWLKNKQAAPRLEVPIPGAQPKPSR
jgi:hypothetical protein